MIFTDQDRRGGRRVSLTRPCKVFVPRSRRYVAGTTCNVSHGGMLLRIARSMNVDIGDQMFVAVAHKRRQSLLHSGDMLEVKIERMLPLTTGELAVAVTFSDPSQENTLPIPRAA